MCHQGNPWEIPYVVRLHNVNLLSEPKDVFKFHHPNRPSTEDGEDETVFFVQQLCYQPLLCLSCEYLPQIKPSHEVPCTVSTNHADFFHCYPFCMRPGPIDNERFITLSFTIKEDSVLHGFAGYFDTVLYKDVMLSMFVCVCMSFCCLRRSLE